MSRYFECSTDSGKTIIDDNTVRYVYSRGTVASGLGYLYDDSGSHGLTSRQEENLMKEIPNDIRIKILCVIPLTLKQGESLIGIRTTLKDPYIGYSVRNPVAGSNTAYIYIYVARGSSVTDIKTVRNVLVIDLYTREISTRGKIGLQVFNQQGNMIFNSNNNIMSIKYFYNNQDVIGNNVGTGDKLFNNCTIWTAIPNLGVIYSPSSTDSVCINNLPGGTIWGGNYSNGGAIFCISGYISFTNAGISVLFGIGQVNIIFTQYELMVYTDWVKGEEMPDWTKTYNAQFGKSLCLSIVR